MKQYRETGFFTNKDGVNSETLDKVKVKVKKGSEKLEVVQAGVIVAAPEPLPVKPKKNCIPFMFFVKEKSKAILVEHNCKSAAGSLKILGEMWGKMSDEDKTPYTEQSAKDKQRQLAQIKEMEENGFFIMADGSKSTDHVKKPKVIKKRAKAS